LTRPMVLRVVGLAVALFLLTAASAGANPTLSYEQASGPLAITATDALTVTLFQNAAAGCDTCDPRLDLRSAQSFEPASPTTLCTPNGDPSFVQCRPLPATVTVTGSPSGDSVTTAGTGSAGCPDPTVRLFGLGGSDVLRGGCADDALDGGDGRDTLDGGGGADALDGGPEADVIDGGPGSDALSGGDGRDLLLPGTGADVVSGGPGVDRVSYETGDPTRDRPVNVTIGGTGDDGDAEGRDTVAGDVEDVIGGTGGDTIVGSAAANDIDGGPGADTIVPGGGADDVEGGAGDDVIDARDGVADRIDCGDGTDRVAADASDSLAGCESADVSRELMPDVDNDGLSAAQGDCSDRDPRIRPGFPDRPGDGVDQDCAGGDAPYPRLLTAVSSGWRFFPRFLRFSKLELVDVPDRARAELRCKGKRRGCFKGVRRRSSPKGAERLKLTALVKRLKLRPGAMLELRIVRPDTLGKVVRYTIRKGRRDPRTRILCLRPGAGKPLPCAKS
jgi:Putative metal-binding motif/RTX calcium-binding nonapeptide repeat (4 copies)